MFKKKTIANIDLKDKRVLMRADYNVPIENGHITDDFRIYQSLETIDALREQNCSIVLMSHLGRPEGAVDPQYSLRPVAERLSELLKQEVKLAPDCVGEETSDMVKRLGPGEILLLENVRFHIEEISGEEDFAKQLASYGEVFVQDAFGVVHRSQASVDGVSMYLPSVSGLLVEKEVKALTKAISHPPKPLVLMIGGAKIADKIEVIDNLLPKTDRLIISGAMANTFLAAKDLRVGKSLYDKDEIDVAKRVMNECTKKDIQLILPLLDVAVSKALDETAERREVATEDVTEDDIILDFGEKSIQSVLHNLEDAGTIIWNGPFGLIENPAFAKGTETVARALADHTTAYTVVGGGDTAGFVHGLGLVHAMSHVSTGGGASLDLLAGKKLPGIEVLLDK